MNGKTTTIGRLIRKFMLAAGVLVCLTVTSLVHATQGPRISVAEPLYDFGTVAAGTVLEHVFEIKNVGDDVLEIKKVAPS